MEQADKLDKRISKNVKQYMDMPWTSNNSSHHFYSYLFIYIFLYKKKVYLRLEYFLLCIFFFFLSKKGDNIDRREEGCVIPLANMTIFFFFQGSIFLLKFDFFSPP